MTTSTDTHVPVTGVQHEISAGPYRATIAAVGGSLRELVRGERSLVLSYDRDELAPGAAGQLLAPWPNRVEDGRYTFDGITHQLDITEPAAETAIHGLARWVSWEPIERAPHRVRLAHMLHGHPGYPFVLALEASYTLDAEAGLRVELRVTNAGSRRAPYGNGAHPYLTLPADTVDGCHLTVPGSRWFPTDERGIPDRGALDVAGTPYDFRKPRPIGELSINHAYTELDRDPDGRAWVRLTHPDDDTGVVLWAGSGYGYLQIYTADELAPPMRRAGLAVEPMTCPPNAFVTGENLITLEPGESMGTSWGITAGRPG